MKELLENHRQVWDEAHAAGYGGYSKFDETRMKWVLSLLPKGFLTRESVVLDIGCGAGNWMKRVSPFVGEVHGVDISPEAINIAKNRLGEYGNIRLYVNDGCTLNLFEENTFNLVYSFWTFQHIPRETTLNYLRESHRVLKENGLLLFQVECYLDPDKNIGDISYLKGKTEQIGYTATELSNITRDSGLKIIRRDQEDFSKYKRIYLWTLCEKIHDFELRRGNGQTTIN